ncbi:Metallo-dependent hydrolase [Lentinula edodes]|uniref:Metallo-dependent hydrolase n=1 Tax=Lentinula edodes TaxID=5353 RepID=A0A1Q3E322_LENED|nr:Metallo-dependent hydrolase [Lentinula edodes]
MSLSASSLSQLEYPGISGPALAALSSLTASDILWIKSLPKAELHAHLNGCVPIEVLFEQLYDIHEFFGAFRTIYALISTRKTLGAATRAVLQGFLDAPNKRKGNNISGLEGGLTPDDYPECTYLELRTTPRRTPALSPKEYLETVLDEVEKYPRDRAALIVSLDRRMGLLSYAPNRLGHATFLDEQARDLVLKDRMLVEVCLSSNIICKTVPNLSSHHISHYLDRGHPIAVCTDDTLPFRTSLTAEYALLLALPPLGLGLTREEVQKVAEGSINGSWMTS